MSGPANLDFSLGFYLEKNLDLYHKPEKNSGDKLKKNQGVQDLKGLKQTLISETLIFRNQGAD